MKKWFKTLLTIGLVSVATLLWAAPQTGSSPAIVDQNYLHPLANDLSVTYLGQFFGNVGSVLHGSSGQLLGHLFSQLNEGIMAAAALWMIYTTFTLFLRGMAEGLNQRLGNTFLVFLRIAIGWALLMPLPNSDGYDSFQTVMMKVVLQGVKLADHVWDWGLDYLQSGGYLYIPPTITLSSKVDQQNYKGFQTAWATLSAMTCQDLSQLQANSKNQNANYTTITNFDKNTYQFQGLGNENWSSSSVPTCGAVTWNLLGNYCETAEKPGNTDNSAVVLCQSQQSAVDSVVDDLKPAAHAISCYESGNAGKPGCSDVPASMNRATLNEQVGQDVSKALIDFKQMMLPVLHYHSVQGKLSYADFFDDAKKHGWILAGRYYWALINYNDNNGSADILNNTVNYNDPFSGNGMSPADGGAPGNFEGSYHQFWQSFGFAKGGDTVKDGDYLAGAKQQAIKALSTYVSNQHDSVGKGRGVDQGGGGGGILELILSVMTGGILGLVGDITALFASASSVAANPLVYLHQLGMQCFNVVGDATIGLGFTMVALFTVMFTCASTQGLGYGTRAVVSFVQPFLMAVILALLNAGIMLAFYMPLYPYILFTIAVVGWFILVLEAMVAAPLVAFGLTHPEGHDFLGKSEQALMLLLSVFLRPALMVVGMLGAMVLSYVALNVANYTFGGLMSDVFSGVHTQFGDLGTHTGVVSVAAGMGNVMGGAMADASGSGDLVIILVVPPVMIALFSMLVKAIVNQCYSLVYVLPDYILRWVGGPTMQGSVEPYAREVQQGVSQMGGQMGKAIGDSMSSASGVGQEKIRKGQSDYETAQKEKKAREEALKKIGKGGGGNENSPS